MTTAKVGKNSKMSVKPYIYLLFVSSTKTNMVIVYFYVTLLND